MLATLTICLHLPGCHSLKEKRGRIKPFISKMQHNFNISIAEIDKNDMWQQSVIGCAMISTDRKHLESAMQSMKVWVDSNWTDGDVIDLVVEFI